MNTDSSLNEIIHSINISDKKQDEFRREIEYVLFLRQLKYNCKMGWPKSKDKVEEIMRLY